MGNGSPGPGVDYPREFEEMDDGFRTEAGCRDAIRRLRWPDAFICGCCGAIEEPWMSGIQLRRIHDFLIWTPPGLQG